MSEPTTDPQALRQQARQARRAFASEPVSAFVRTMRDVMAQYLRARAEGVSREDAVRGIEAELREAWPGNTSKFVPDCAFCDDTGWREHVCTEALRCGRERCARQHPAWEHPYVASCGCQTGQTHRRRVQTPDDAVNATGRTQKPKKGFTRFGS